jgi:hypothetical protein
MTPTKFDEFEEFMTTPALGAQSKREIEIKFVQILFGGTLNTVSVEEATKRLGVTRRRATSLLLEARLRSNRTEDPADLRARMLNLLGGSKNSTGLVDLNANRIEFVVDNPEIREKLKNFASANRIPMDRNLSSDVLSISWNSWAALLDELTVHMTTTDRRELVARVSKDLQAQSPFLRKSEMRNALNKVTARNFATLAKTILTAAAAA